MFGKKLVNWFQKYGYYVVGGILLLAIGFTLMNVVNTNPTPDAIDVSGEPLSFRLPMNEVTVIKEYSDTELMFNKTLGRWEAHKAYALTSEDLKVFAVARGTVSEVGKNNDLGNYVIITHEGGLKTMYASLDENVLVSNGTTIEKGQLIGMASDSAEHFSKEGKHLHFVMYKNDTKVNPSTYLSFGNK